jgi:hypothetical protein
MEYGQTSESLTWHQRNKDRARENHRRYVERNREKVLANKRDWYYREGRKRDLMKLYGITQDEYDAILEAQNFHCALCKISEGLCVDHNHTTGEVRGILCYDCNRNFIGNNEDPEKYKRAAIYLEGRSNR